MILDVTPTAAYTNGGSVFTGADSATFTLTVQSAIGLKSPDQVSGEAEFKVVRGYSDRRQATAPSIDK